MVTKAATLAGGASRAYLLALLAALMTAGCSSSDISDLEQYVEETRASQVGRIDPLPQFKPFDTYAYSADSIRDPFVPWRDIADVAQTKRTAGTGPQPDFDRRKELLEKFPLDSLRMVGRLQREDGDWAIIRAPDGMVYRVKQGNYLGQNHGKIVSMADQSIGIVELIPDGLGGWTERQASLTIVE
jgi:type IV pilus assembly protein PilP